MSRQSLRHRMLFAIAGLMCFSALWAGPVMAGVNKVPVPGMVTMVDLGAKKCVPCKMMAPILEALEKEYKERASIISIGVSQRIAEG